MDDEHELNNEDEDKGVFWWVSPDNKEAREWLNKLDQLKRIDINELTFKRVDSIWDGPLYGVAEYKGKDHYYVAIFDEEGPSLNVNVGRCYLLLKITDELKEGRESDLEGKEPDLDYSDPIGYFGGSLGYFMTKTDVMKEKK